MQIIVVGAGAIGSLYGAKLAAQNEVTLIGRPEHTREINRHGLHLSGLETAHIQLPAAASLEAVGPDAVILLTSKVHDSASALAPIAPLVRPDTTIVALQNGLESAALARAAVGGRGIVLRGITQFGAIFEGPGRINYTVRGHTLLEEHERSARIAAVLQAAGLNCRISPNIAKEIWRKLIFNCVVNPITTIVGSKVCGIADPGLRSLKQLVIDECLSVAFAEGVSFDLDFMQEIDRVFGASQNVVSTRQDLERGRRTEIDYLNGAVVECGEKHGLKCPANRALTEIIKAMERGA